MKESLILLIETATSICSVALSVNGKVIARIDRNERNIHASHITLFITEVMERSGRKLADLDAVAVSKGPGSYTGLRIGVSTAKGLCFALDLPLLAIDTLESMALGVLEDSSVESDTLLVPMIDARRREVYTAIFRPDLTIVEPVSAKIIDPLSFDSFSEKLLLFGDGSDKFREEFKDKSHIQFGSFDNSAAFMAPLAYQKFLNADFEDLAYFEPYYLKEFLVTSPKSPN